MILKDDVTAAIRRAFQLGQTYWQQADSESYKENKKADATRDRYNALCIETAEIAARADTRIAELETAMKRQAAAVRMLDMSHVARAETMMQHAQVLHDQSNTAALESERQANALLTERVSRLETELEVARRDAERLDWFRTLTPHKLARIRAAFMPDSAGDVRATIDAARAGNGGEG